MPKRPLRICLIMHSTRSDNLGVGALTVSEIAILRDIARDLGRQFEITVIDPRGSRTPYVDGPDVTILDLNSLFMINPMGLFSALRASDLVIDIGAGDSFADIYGRRRLMRMFVMKFMTHLAGRPLVVAPQTVGPFTKGWSKFLARISLNRSALVSVRDEKSLQALRDLGYQGQVIEASDVALRLPYDPPAPQRREGPMRVGINVSGLLMNGGYSGQNEFGISLDYPALMRNLIRFFQSEGCEVHMVAHVLPQDRAKTHREDDYFAAAQLVKEFPGTVLAPAFDSPSNAKTYIATLDFFMGARMHACIAAFSAGVPVVPMAYSRKFAGLFGSIGYAHTVDCTSRGDDEVLSHIITAFHDRAKLIEDAKVSMQLGVEKLYLYEEGLRKLLVA